VVETDATRNVHLPLLELFVCRILAIIVSAHCYRSWQFNSIDDLGLPLFYRWVEWSVRVIARQV